MKNNKILEMIMIVLLLISMVILSKNAAQIVNTLAVKVENQKVVVIDAGHGGTDPGKVGINGALEKDINLLIAKRLTKLLEANGVKVIMTRNEDKGLYEDTDSNKKVVDMKNRLHIMETEKPDLIVSLHQNSYSSESVKGAQVFYYKTSEEGAKIANIFQKQLIKTLDPSNHRVEKGNDSYFLLKKTSYPIVIVECGFLSNQEEAQLLNTVEYQEKVAWATHLGVMQYLNGQR